MIFSLLSPLPDSTCWPLVIQTRTILLLTRKPWNLEPSHFNSCQHVYFVACVCEAGEGRLEYPVNRLARELTIFSVGRNLVPWLLLHLLPSGEGRCSPFGRGGASNCVLTAKDVHILGPSVSFFEGAVGLLAHLHPRPVPTPQLHVFRFLHHKNIVHHFLNVIWNIKQTNMFKYQIFKYF